MRKLRLVMTVTFAGSMAIAGLARADKTGSTPPPTTQMIGANESAEVQHLRAARKELNTAKDEFDRDPVDKADHRKEILEGIDSSLKAIDAEIDELLGK